MFLKQETQKYEHSVLSGAKVVAEIAFKIIENNDKSIEHFLYFCLDSQNKIISIGAFEGDVGRVSVWQRQILKTALLHNATALIVCHNHPSGVCKPSHEDIACTKKLKSACELFDITLHDHIIISTQSSILSDKFELNGILSFNEMGYL